METRANYVAIGAFVMIVLLAVLGALYWLYRAAEPGASSPVRIIFTEPVSGLSTGGTVFFNGIRVGEVAQLQFAPGGGDDVIAIARISQNAPIKTDTVAKLGFQGLTGVAYISLTGGSESAPSLFDSADDDAMPTIRAETSAFTNVVDSAQTVLQRVNTTLNEINSFLGDNRPKLDEVVTNVTELTGTLNEAAPQVSGLITDMASAGRAVAAAGPQITGVVERANTLLGAIEPQQVTAIVDNAAAFSASLPEIGARAGVIVDNVDGLVTRLDDAAATLGEAVTAVRNVVEGIDTDAVGTIVANVRTATGAIASRADEIGSLIDNASAVATDLRGLADTVAARQEAIGEALDGLTGLVADARGAVASAAPAIERFGTALDAVTPERVEAIVASVDRITTDFAGQMPALNSFIASATEAASSIATLSERLMARADVIDAAVVDGAAMIHNLREASTGAPQIVSGINARIDELGNIIGAIDPDAVSQMVSGASRFVTNIADQEERINALLTGADSAIRNIDTIASSLALKVPELDGIIDRVNETTVAVKTFADALPEFAGTLRPGIENMSQVLAAIEPAAVESIVSDASSFMAGLAEQRAPLAELIADTTRAVRNIDTATAALADSAPRIRSIIGEVEATMTPVRAFSEELPALAAALKPGVENASDVLSAIDPQAVSGIIDSAARFAETIAAQDEHIASILTSADATVRRIEAISSSLAIRMPQIGEIVDHVEATARSAETFAAALPEFAETLRPGIENVSAVMAAVEPDAVESLVNDAASFMEGLDAQREPIARLITNADATAREAADLAASVNAQMPQIGEIVANVRQATENLPRLVASLEPGVENVGTVLSSLDAAEIAAIQRDVATFADTLASQSDQIKTLIEGASGASVRIEAVAAALAQRMPQIGTIIDETEGAVGAARRFADALPGFAETLQPGIENVSEALQAIDPETVEALVQSVSDFAGMLSSESETIREILNETRGAVADANRILAAVSARTPEITSAIDGASRAVSSVEDFTAKLPALATRLEPAIDNIAQVLEAVDPEAIRTLVSNVEAVANAIGEEAPRIKSIIAAADRATNSAATITERLSGEMNRVSAILQDAEVALVNARQFAAGLPVLLDDIKPGLINASEALGAIDPNAIATIVDNALSLSETLLDNEAQITQVLTSASRAAEQIETVTAAVSGRIDEISGIIDRVSSFAGNLSAVGPQIEGLVTRADGALEAVRNTVNAVNAGAINDIVANVRRVADAVGSRAGEIGAAIDNATQAAKGLAEGLGTLGGSDGTLKQILDQAKAIGNNLEGASEQVRVVVARINNLLDGPVQGMVGNVSNAARDVGEVAAAFASRAGQIASGLGRFSTGGLDDLRAVLNQGRSTLSAIETAVSSFDRDPSRVIFGGSDGPRYSPQRR